MKFFFYFSIIIYCHNLIYAIHPKLPDPKKSNCKVCHSDIFKEKIHSPIEDCFSCHNFEFKEEKQYVNILKPLPLLCFDCHKDLENFKDKKSFHMVYEECLSCHNPHSSNEKNLLLKPLSELCSECHDIKELKEKKHKNQPIDGKNCLSCHNPHFSMNEKLIKGTLQHLVFKERECESCHSKTLTKKSRFKAPVPFLCFACHPEVEKDLNQKFRHSPFVENNCLSCHNPHLADEKHLLVDKENKLCLKCHKNIVKEGKVHEPVEEGCLNCHRAHSSQKEFLISSELMGDDKISTLCFNCHNNDEKLKEKHRGADMVNINCTTCHNIHSSKDKNLLNETSVHPVFEDCQNCHGKKIELLKKEPTLCFDCHPEVQEKISSYKVKHSVMESPCTYCHSPHLSNQRFLLKSSTKIICKSCHEYRYNFEHKIISLLGCNSCHFPHGSNLKNHLKKEGNGLCLSCHLIGNITDEEKNLGINYPKIKLNKSMDSGHPSIEHPVSGKFKRKEKFEGEITCLSCHNPHGGQTKDLFTFDSKNQTQLCGNCHIK